MKIKDIIYVSIQFILFIIYAVVPPKWTFNLPFLLNILFLILAFIGILVLVLGLLQLNKNLSPFPTPKIKSELVTHGMYKWMRHPIYSGIILFALGYALYSSNGYRLFTAILLWILFYFKSAYEENLLKEKYEDYAAYQKKTKRFFPFF